ncbi:MAG: restriction endonuclease subunit S [Bacteroidales bacterium]|nr:restriction endonuclease subunit S [Bacteroidales bacterium]
MHIVDRKIKPDFEFSISNEKYESLPNYHLKTGDIIMGRRGEMGRCGLITEEENGWFCGTGNLFIRPRKDLNPVYILYVLSGENAVKYLENEAIGITMKNLNKKIIQNIKFGLPPIELQNDFAGIIKHIETQKQLACQSLQKSEELFQSLLQRAFRPAN